MSYLRNKREKSEYTLTSLANLLGMSKQRLSLIELGKASPTITQLYLMSVMLQCDLKELTMHFVKQESELRRYQRKQQA